MISFIFRANQICCLLIMMKLTHAAVTASGGRCLEKMMTSNRLKSRDTSEMSVHSQK